MKMVHAGVADEAEQDFTGRLGANDEHLALLACDGNAVAGLEVGEHSLQFVFVQSFLRFTKESTSLNRCGLIVII